MDYIQHCFGEYDKSFCEGNPKAEDFAESLPCNRRDKCHAFKLFLKEADKEKVDYFEVDGFTDDDGNETYFAAIENVEEFLGFCGQLVDRYNTHTRTIRKKHYKVVENSAPARRKGYKYWKKVREQRGRRIAKNRVREIKRMFSDFFEILAAKFPAAYTLTKDGTIPLPGQIFAVRRVDFYKRSSVDFYLKGYGPNNILLFQLIPHYAVKKIEAILYADCEWVRRSIGDRLSNLLEIGPRGERTETRLLDAIGLNILATALSYFIESAMNEIRETGQR